MQMPDQQHNEWHNLQLNVQSPTLNIQFHYYDEIETNVGITNHSFQSTLTSSNRDVFALLQQHVAEVSDMSKRGIRAVHERTEAPIWKTRPSTLVKKQFLLMLRLLLASKNILLTIRT